MKTRKLAGTTRLIPPLYTCNRILRGGLAGLALAATLLLAGCWGGISPILEDYNSRFAVDTVDAPPAQTPPQPPAQPQQPQPPAQPDPPNQPQPIAVVRPVAATILSGDMNYGSLVSGGEKYTWEIKKRDGSLWTSYRLTAASGRTLHSYLPASGLKLTDSPLTVKCTVTIDGQDHTGEGLIILCKDSDEFFSYAAIINNKKGQ